MSRIASCAGGLLLLAWIAGCDRRPALPPDRSPPLKLGSAQLQPEQPGSFAGPLTEAAAMSAVFGSSYRQQAGFARWQPLQLPASQQHDPRFANWIDGRALARSLGIRQLDPRHAILITQATQADEHWQAQDCHACSALLSAFWFELRDGRWQHRRSQHAISETGNMGNAGELRFVQLGPQQAGFAINGGGVWQGYLLGWLELFAIDDDGVRQLTPASGIRTHSDNLGNCDNDRQPGCYQISANWQLLAHQPPGDYFDLQLQFTGSETDAGGKTRPIDQRAIYRLESGEFRLRSGSNPAPEA